MHIIKDQNSIVKINETGAELKSFVFKGAEIIWQSDLNIWKGSAPILFPFVGRLKDSKYVYRGKEYKINKHGFVRNKIFEVENKAQNTVSFITVSTEETKEIYPFDFLLRVFFSLKNNILNVCYEVENHGSETMYFCLGSHPGISLPLVNTTLNDYYIEFDEKEYLHTYKLVNDLLVKQAVPYLNNENIIKLNNNIFDEDALIFSGVKSGSIYIKNSKTGRNIKVNINNAPDLGIWAKPGAPYVCIEPWFGHDDLAEATGKLEEKKGIVSLNPASVFKTYYAIEVLTL